MSVPSQPARVLILYYSYSGQSSVLVRRLATGLSDEGVMVRQERICPLQPLRFPMGSILRTIRLMLIALFRVRHPIQPLEVEDGDPCDLVILAGPTWSWNASGPVLSLLDTRPGLFRGRPVLAMISCRGYWSSHWRYLRRRLAKMGTTAMGPLVFAHPQTEPWRTIGVFFKIAGTAPERSSSLLSYFYFRFGHTPEQFEEAHQLGRRLAAHLQAGSIPADFKHLP